MAQILSVICGMATKPLASTTLQTENPNHIRKPMTAQAEPIVPLRLLFVCVENSNRSQMAQAFAIIHGQSLASSPVEAYSAGSQPSGIINPKAIKAMSELGYDLSQHQSHATSALPEIEFDFIATMGCGDACGHLPGKIREDWPLPDPRNMAPTEFNQVRDQIEQRVIRTLKHLENTRR